MGSSPERTKLASHTIEAIRDRLEAATPGPWTLLDQGYGRWGVGCKRWPRTPSVVYAHSAWDGFGNGSREADAALIAAAPTDLALLLAVAEAAKEMANAFPTFIELRDAQLRLRAALSALEDP